MKYSNLPLTVLFLLLALGLSAQSNGVATYPIGNSPESEMGKAFSALFSNESVGNLHVYATASEEPPRDYFFLGTLVDQRFYGLLNAAWQREVLPEEAQLFAVRTIRHGAGLQYLMRFYTPELGHRLELFTLFNERLEHVTTLAYVDCGRGRCFQLDSWIQDIDGDTDLDIVKKFRITDRRTDRFVEEFTNLYLQSDSRRFEANRTVQIRSTDFNLQSIDLREIGQ